MSKSSTELIVRRSAYNQVSNVSPLLQVTSLQTLHVRYDPIPCPNSALDALVVRGVTVTSDCN